jgi:hypothetical protein
MFGSGFVKQADFSDSRAERRENETDSWEFRMPGGNRYRYDIYVRCVCSFYNTLAYVHVVPSNYRHSLQNYA